jgi:Putative Actinobacterial Holin-X, holin superfamily III
MTTTRDNTTANHTNGRAPQGEHRSLGELVATLSRDLALLIHQEIELAKADLAAGLKKIAIGAAGLVLAAVLLIVAVPVISIASALGIHALGISLGWSFLIVAGGFILLAAIAALIGIKQLAKGKPSTRAVDGVKADLHTLTRKPSAY